MIDAIFFQETNPNHTRPFINQSIEQDLLDEAWIIFGSDNRSTNQLDQVKSNDKDLAKMNEDDLILCNPIVLGFSYDNKIWGELS